MCVILNELKDLLAFVKNLVVPLFVLLFHIINFPLHLNI